MAQPDLHGGARSEQARAADQLQTQLARRRQTVFGVTFWVVVLIEAGLWYWGVEVWVRIVVPLMWIGFLIHNNALLILHEIWEINDQLSGRKDEYRALLNHNGDDRN